MTLPCRRRRDALFIVLRWNAANPGTGPQGRVSGAFVGGVFGAVWLIASAGTPLGAGAAWAFRIVGVLGVAALAVGTRRAERRMATLERPGGAARGPGRAFRRIVAAEGAALVLGIALLEVAGAPSEIYRPWTVIVVGLHFVAFRLAGVWRAGVAWPAAPLLAVGLAGFALAFTSAADWVALVTGEGAGFTLLGGSLAVVLRESTREPHAGPVAEAEAG